MILLSSITPDDDAVMAQLIRTVLTEFGANKPGTVFTDPTTDALSTLFQTPKAHYLVARDGSTLAGGCGIYPTQGLPEGCTELVKLYVSAKYRGSGLGKQLMSAAIELAKQEGYREIYLETLPELHIAVGLYEHLGFTYLDEPYGDSGHFACDLWMRKML